MGTCPRLFDPFGDTWAVATRKEELAKDERILRTMRVATGIILILAIGFVMISPVSDLDAAVHHHRSHHSPALLLNAEVVLASVAGAVALTTGHKPVRERTLTSRQSALLRC